MSNDKGWPAIPKWQQMGIIGFVAGVLTVIVALLIAR
jgi:hypothetical protein